jgi:Tol biopolymer transport system component
MNRTYLLLTLLLGLIGLSSCDNLTSPSSTISDSYLHGRAAWSPDGKTIAFSSMVSGQEGIYVVDTLGGTPARILQGEGVGVTWSPDGKWIAFAKGGSVFRMKPNGDSVTQLTDPINAIRPSWSPDGSKIAFIERDASGYTSLWVYDVVKASSSMIVSRGDYPSWIPSSGEIVVLDGQYDPYSGYTAYAFIAVNPTTTNARLINSFTATASCGFSAMSPAGTDIVFGALPSNDYSEVYRYNLAATTNYQLTTDGGDYPAWNPTGTQLVYTRTQQGDGGLWIMNTDGTGKRRLTKAQ